MKRTTTIKINNEDYILCYSTRVVRAVTDKFGSPGKMDEALKNEDSAVDRIEANLFVLSALLKAGAAYAKLEGAENPRPLSLEELHTFYPIMHPRIIYAKIKEAIALGSAVSVEIKEKPQSGKKQKQSIKRKITGDSYIWYGLHLGLDYNTTLDIPHGELLSLINEEQIQNGIADEIIKNSEEDPFPDWD